jgi:hypothetical protein
MVDDSPYADVRERTETVLFLGFCFVAWVAIEGYRIARRVLRCD